MLFRSGFANYMLMLTQCKRLNQECIGVVEGDDGLFVFPVGQTPRTEDFVECGCIIKLEVFDKISHASFCGLLFDETDRQIVADIRKIMASFGWSSRQYVGAKSKTHLALLRCKAMSLIVQYPSCPIVACMARYVLRCTKHIDVRRIIERGKFDMYTRERLIYGMRNFKHNLNAEIGLGTRLLVFDLWGFDLPSQYRFEQYFDSQTFLTPIDVYSVKDLFPKSWSEFSEKFVVELKKDAPLFRTYETDSRVI